jgi:hypothetical protein
MDRRDVRFAAKELARGLSRSQRRHTQGLRRAVGYLLHAPNLVWKHCKQKWPTRIRT